ncbi:CRAL/TRIO domain-containing protein [Atractiella rhizophila]|nr:CRAL/TRIO domain-containing protein [Atractiella rhizophila]
MAVSSPIPEPDPTTQLPPPPPAIQTIPNYEQIIATLVVHFGSPDFLLPTSVKALKAFQKSRSKFIPSRYSPSPQISPSYSSYRKAALEAQQKHPEDWRPLTEWEKWFLTSQQFGRFLRAVKGDEFRTLERAEVTTTWRREYGVDELTEDVVEEESKTGKQMVLGHDNHRRPCLYMYPYRQNTKVSPRQIQFVVWTLERAIDLMPPGVENLCLMIDFGSGVGGGGQPTTPGQAKKVLEILQTYYCERLGRAVCINVPMLFWGFYKLLGPFIDPITKDKIRFNPDVRALVPPSQLEKAMFKGDLDFEYKHEEFYPALAKLCKQRREEQFERWKKAGGRVGEDEWIIKGGEVEQEETKPNGEMVNGTAAAEHTHVSEEDLKEEERPRRPSRKDTASHDCGDDVMGDQAPDPNTIETPESSIFRGSSGTNTPSSFSSRRSSTSNVDEDENRKVVKQIQEISLKTNGYANTDEALSDLTTPRVTKTPLLPDEVPEERKDDVKKVVA